MSNASTEKSNVEPRVRPSADSGAERTWVAESKFASVKKNDWRRTGRDVEHDDDALAGGADADRLLLEHREVDVPSRLVSMSTSYPAG